MRRSGHRGWTERAAGTARPGIGGAVRRHVPKDQEEGRLQREVLHRRGRDRVLLPVGDESPGGIVLDDRLHLLVERGALRLVGGGAGFLEQRIHLRVRVVAGVEAALVGEGVGAERKVGQRVGIVGHPRHLGHVGLALEARVHLAEEGVPLVGLDLDVEPDLGKVGLDRRAHGDGIEHARAAVGHVEGELGTLGTGLLEQRLRLLRVVGVGLERFVIGPGEGRRGRAGGDFGRALEHVLDQRLFVDRVVDRLAHPLVGERAFLGVEDEEPQVRPGLLIDLELVVVAELAEIVRRNLDHQVDAARQHLGDAGIGIGDRAVDDGLQRRRAVPVVLVAGDDDAGVGVPVLELEGAGARRIAAEVLAVLLHRGRRDDQPGRIGEVGEERGVGRVELELDGLGVDRGGRLDGREEEGERERAGAVERMALVEHPVEGELDRLGIERRPVVELDALAKVEGVGQAVVGDVPGLRQRRLGLQRAVLIADQAVIHVHQDAEVVDRGVDARVERLRLRDLSHDQDVGRRLRLGRQAGGDADGEREPGEGFGERGHGVVSSSFEQATHSIIVN